MVEYELKCSQSIVSVMGVLVLCNEKVAFYNQVIEDYSNWIRSVRRRNYLSQDLILCTCVERRPSGVVVD